MVATLRLVLCHLVLRLVARRDTLLVSPGSPATSAGFHQTLALDLTKHTAGTETEKHRPRKHRPISLCHAK